MPDLPIPVEGVLLMFVLGLRHGLDPDHIAMVDAMAYGRAGGRSTRSWRLGAMFAAGHGAAVTAAAIAMQAARGELSFAEPYATLFGWLPALLLAATGTANLRSLLRAGNAPYRPAGLGGWLLPRWCDPAHPLAAFAVGILFALVFDTASQLAAWSHAGSAKQGAAAALIAGLAFTAGMIAVDALDGALMSRLLGASARERYRRRVGWVTVAAAYAVALHAVLAACWPALELEEHTLNAIGAAMIALFALVAWRARRHGATAPAAA